jgi:uncharacterized alpha-E superfamily protein
MSETFDELRRLASTVRDRLSIDTWRILNQLRHDVRVREGKPQLDDAFSQLNRMITDLAAFSGMEMENMTRGHGWRLSRHRPRLERSLNMAALLRTSLSRGQRNEVVLGPLARDCRQRDDLPAAVLRAAATLAGARPAGG